LLQRTNISDLQYSSTSPLRRGGGEVVAQRYEISNHLGNVITVFSDRKMALDDGYHNIDSYKTHLVSSQDYTPFGMIMDFRGKNAASAEYRFGFNGKEKDDEIKGTGNSLDFGARIYDPRTGRWLSIDPLFKNYPNLSSYNFCANNPICFLDINGKKIFIYYENEKGEQISYEYKSKLKPPDNPFVQQTVAALDKIASSPKVADKLSFLVETKDYNINIMSHYENISWNSTSKSKDKNGNEIEEPRKDQDIMFNENLALKEVKTGAVNAPFINLWHELGHKYNLLKNPKSFFSRRNNTFKDDVPNKEKWDNEEEKYNIQENEHPLVEDTEGFKRETHGEGGNSGVKEIRTKSSTSTEPR